MFYHLHGKETHCMEDRCKVGSCNTDLPHYSKSFDCWITSGHISSSLCKLQLSTHLSSSRNTNGHHTEILLCWAASSLEGSLGAGKSCYPKSPGKNPSPCPTLADTQTASFQTAAGTTKLCAHCTKQTYRIENWRQRLCAENTGTSHLSCWNR